MDLRAYLLTALTLIYTQTTVHAQYEQCTIPNGSKGKCVPLRQCAKVVQILSFYKSKPIPRNVLQVLEKYNCGYGPREPLVCCPEPNGGAPVSNKPPVVSNHRNLYLINGENCGVSLPNKIAGGTEADISEFPWMALISYRDNQGKLSFRCAGSLISPRFVLTAAHCIDGSAKVVGVRLGEHNVRTKVDCQKTFEGQVCAQPVQDFAVDKIISFPGYDSAKKINDIGLIKLAKSPDFSADNVGTVCLPVSNLATADLSTRKVTVAGWGLTDKGFNSDVLLKVTVPVVKNDQCKNIYKKILTINEKEICTDSTKGQLACTGDSGGPLFRSDSFQDSFKAFQYGIVSFGPRFCGSQDVPGVYTRVAYYMDWILNNIDS